MTLRTARRRGDDWEHLAGDMRDIAAVRPDQSVGDAILMKSRDIKRLVVMTDSKLEGIVSLGDLAARGEDADVEDDISRAEPNN